MTMSKNRRRKLRRYDDPRVIIERESEGHTDHSLPFFIIVVFVIMIGVMFAEGVFR